MTDTTKKPTLYEILEVSPEATLAEIKAAHRRLSHALIVGESGLSRDDIELKLQVLDVALSTLVESWSRDAYDAKLATPISPPKTTVSPLAVSHDADYNPMAVAAAITKNHNIAAATSEAPTPLSIASTAVSGTAKALNTILRIVGLLLVLAVVIRMASCGMRWSAPTPRPEELYPAAVAKAVEKVAIQDYYQKHGVRPASLAEVQELEIKDRLQQQELRKQSAQESEYSRLVEQSRNEGDQVVAELQQAEERARYMEERARQRAEWEKQREIERAAIEGGGNTVE